MLSIVFVCIFAIAAFVFWQAQSAVTILGKEYKTDTTELDLSNSDFGSEPSEVADLGRFIKLERLDLRNTQIGIEDFESIRKMYPSCEILWSVPMGGEKISSIKKSLSIGNLDTSEFYKLKYFPLLETVDASGCDDYEAILRLVSEYEEISFKWTVKLLGLTFDSDAEEIEIKGKKIDNPEDITNALKYLPNVKAAGIYSCNLSHEQMYKLQEQTKGCTFSWDFKLSGVTVKTNAKTVDMKQKRITDLDAFREGLRHFTGLEKIDMCGCGLSNKTMESLIAEFPKTKFVWRVYMGKWSLRTDTTYFSTKNFARNKDPKGYRLTNDDIQVLKYCTDLEALDLGHNNISDITVIGTLTKLQILILADCRISDISPIANLKDLYYLELFMNNIKDISPLAGLTNLLDLNYCHNYATDLTPLNNLPKLERLWCSYNGISAAKVNAFKKSHPDCNVQSALYWSTGNGWRTHKRYYEMIKKLHM
jgi:Leucine-rich repeat (LRR) protein